MLYTAKKETASPRSVVLDDMILTREFPTTAGSKMLEGYLSLFDATVVTALEAKGYEIAGKANVGEFSVDLIGETSYFGPALREGKPVFAAAELVRSGETSAALCLDVNGAPRRGAAQAGILCLKPTYGTVSRFGTIPAACSGETVSVLAPTADAAEDLLDAIAGHDQRDGTSLPEEQCARLKKGAPVSPVRRVAVPNSFEDTEEARALLSETANRLSALGVEVVSVKDELLYRAFAAWNILMSAELCNNVSRYDGVKYGYRSANFSGLDELYVNSRSEAFGNCLKSLILFGSETLSTQNYKVQYDKALRFRRVIAEEFERLFAEFDAVLLPAVSRMSYEGGSEADPYRFMEENRYTAPASLTGLPAVVTCGVQFIGKAFSERALLGLARELEKEGK